MKISFSDVHLHAKNYKTQILKKIDRLTSKGIFLNGEENRKLIVNLKKFFPKKNIILTASGHDSLLIALRCLDLKNDDEVIFPVNSYPTAFPVFLSGGKPIPVDIDENGLIDLGKLKQKISNKTKAIIVVHLYGLVVDLDEVKKIIGKRKIVIVEDCAQAFGSLYKNRQVGNFGDIACLSFYPTKNLATLGDGGALITGNRKFFSFFEKAVSYGEKARYRSQFVAGHSRLPEIQAGVLNIYLKNINRYLENRRKVHRLYLKFLEKYDLQKFIRLLYSDRKSLPVPHVFVVEAKHREKLAKYLQQKGIPVLIHFPYPIHLLKAFKHPDYSRKSFPNAEKLAANILSLPFHSYLTGKQVEKIVREIKKFYETKKSKKS